MKNKYFILKLIIIFKYFKWNIRKACAVSLLINFASMIAAFMAQQYLITKLPAEWFFLHHILNHYASVFLTFVSVTIIVKVLIETLVLSFFDKEISNSLVWIVVIVMNLITALPGSVYDFVRGKPEINKPFSLIENADWIKNSEENKVITFDAGVWCPLEYFNSYREIDYLGTKFKIPEKAEKFLEWNYGPNWRIPCVLDTYNRKRQWIKCDENGEPFRPFQVLDVPPSFYRGAV